MGIRAAIKALFCKESTTVPTPVSNGGENRALFSHIMRESELCHFLDVDQETLDELRIKHKLPMIEGMIISM